MSKQKVKGNTLKDWNDLMTANIQDVLDGVIPVERANVLVKSANVAVKSITAETNLRVRNNMDLDEIDRI